MGNPIIFIVLAAIALASGLGMLLSRNAVHSALFLVLNFSTIAVLFLILNAPFLFVTQIIIYAGAIMVLFLFVVMLLGAERLREAPVEIGGWQVPLALLLLVALLVVSGVVVFGGDALSATGDPPVDAGPVEVGLTLFESYVFPFEVASVLLLVAMIGVVVLRTRGKNG
ncbi:MAG: NADH-quinone oxidoreductase subunit J [Candidatus Promineifilaceae bacterium]|nr:NADH-quinone oxidoreductase subunit J [Candidatus Promineifilaceae bacterium]